MINQIDIAKRICEMLEKEKFDKSTPYIFSMLNLERPFGRYRKILQRLTDKGVLQRTGVGKFRWKLINKDWDRTNPFKTITASSESQLKQDLRGVRQEDLVVIEGKTFEHRTHLKTIGCDWDIENRKWTMPWTQVAKLENTIGNYTELLLKGAAKAAREASGVDYGPAIESLKKRMESLEDTKRVEIIIKNHNGKEVKTFKERTHPIFEQVMFHVNCGDNVMLVGPKGCGKTYLAQQVADALGRKCGIFPISGGVTEGKLFGRVVPNINTGKSEFQETLLVQLFERGGVALIDEVDAGDPNVLVALNSALANGVLTLDRPKKPIAERHEEFICVAAANTWGNGADRQYVGRNQLDAAFVERFVQLEMDYDRGLERALCKGADELVTRLHKYRDAVLANRLERTISTRIILRAYNWLQHGKNLEYIDQMIFAGWRDEEVRKVKGG
jgi:cobaltochelatase CobS